MRFIYESLLICPVFIVIDKVIYLIDKIFYVNGVAFCG